MTQNSNPTSNIKTSNIAAAPITSGAVVDTSTAKIVAVAPKKQFTDFDEMTLKDLIINLQKSAITAHEEGHMDYSADYSNAVSSLGQAVSKLQLISIQAKAFFADNYINDTFKTNTVRVFRFTG